VHGLQRRRCPPLLRNSELARAMVTRAAIQKEMLPR
jgi:hypothetical protein